MGPAPNPNFLIIDGHGAMSKKPFDFRRPATAKSAIYYYTFEKIGINVERSDRIIEKALGGVVPEGYSECRESRIGGTLVADRILAAKASGDWITPVPPGATLETIHLNGVPVDCHYIGRPGVQVSLATAWIVVVFIQDRNEGILNLSDIIDYFATGSYNVIWAPCN